MKEKRDPQHSLDWRPMAEQGESEETPAALPPAALRKKKKLTVETPKISLEERLAGENIIEQELEEDEKFRLQRLKDKTTGGQYHIYLGIFLLCILLSFACQRLLPSEFLDATGSVGKTVVAAGNRLVVPNAVATFSSGLRYYEDEVTRNTKKGNIITSFTAGWEAARKVAQADGAPSTVSKSRKGWYQLPTGFLFGWPAAGLFTIRQTVYAAITDKSALELTLTGFLYLSIISISTMTYMQCQRRWPLLPTGIAPVAIICLMSVTSIVVMAVLSFVESLCRQLMPDTIVLFTTLAITSVAALSTRSAFFAPKKGNRRR